MFYILSAAVLFIALGLGYYLTLHIDRGLDDE